MGKLFDKVKKYTVDEDFDDGFFEDEEFEDDEEFASDKEVEEPEDRDETEDLNWTEESDQFEELEEIDNSEEQELEEEIDDLEEPNAEEDVYFEEGIEEEHQKVVEQLKQAGFQQVWLVGEEFAKTECSFKKFHDIEEVKAAIAAQQPQDMYILIKEYDNIVDEGLKIRDNIAAIGSFEIGRASCRERV